MKLLTADRVITGRPGEVLERAGVLVDGTGIAWVGTLDGLTAERRADAEVIDLPGSSLLPGLIDCHVHLAFDASADPVAHMRRSTDTELVILMLHSARELLMAGVTTARDLGARGFLDIGVKRAINEGLAEGPRLLTVTRPITVTGGHCWFMGGEFDGLDAVRYAVRLHHREGADLIKVMATGGVMTPGSAHWHAQFSAEELAAIVEESHRLDKRVAAHCHGTPGIVLAVGAGVDTIEHCSWLARGGVQEYEPTVADAIAEADIHVCPTVSCRSMTLGKERWERRAERLTWMREAGVQIVAGTDAGINLNPHGAYVGGLEALVASGMSTAEVLEAATLRAARALDLETVTGSLEAGKEADVIAVEGNPLTDIGNLRSPRLVMTRGRIAVGAPARTGNART
ncbi:MAG TPA: amidohydrolase family protein [Candidatus Dormibacteraeota bacterium]|nr:amidohydrolase family protein [Candidatus Dormibacteraeota bacterium]